MESSISLDFPTLETPWSLYGVEINSRLWMGTSGYPNLQSLKYACELAQPGFLTLSLRRQTPEGGQGFWSILQSLNIPLLPNTAGCYSAQEAIMLAHISRDTLATDWIKVEVIGDDQSLHPDPFGLIQACEVLVKQGFKVLPYCTDDLVLCRKLVDVGCQALMPLGAPIGTGLGLLNPFNLERLRNRFSDITLILDAGLGKPSQAAAVMELGFDAVLLNTAITQAKNPTRMALAFRRAVEAGYEASQAIPMQAQPNASPSTPSLDVPLSGVQCFEGEQA